MKRRDFLKSLAAGTTAILLPVRLLKALAEDGQVQIQLVDQFDQLYPITAVGTAHYGVTLQFQNGIATVQLKGWGDVDGDGTIAAANDVFLIQKAAQGDTTVLNQLDEQAEIFANVSGYDPNDPLLIAADDAVIIYLAHNGDWSKIKASLPHGKRLIVPVSVDSGEGFVGVHDFPMIVTQTNVPRIAVWKNAPLTDSYLSQRYANNLDLYANLTSGKKWNSIGINYGDYSFANINHSQIMRGEAAKLNASLGFELFKENNSNPNVTVDYSAEQSRGEILLYDANQNPVSGKIYKKKYCGAENWSKAEAQRLLASLALGKPLDDQFFPDERIAVEVQDQRIPTEVLDALKARYKTAPSVSNMNEYEQKPKIIVDGKAEINNPIKLIVLGPEGATDHNLEYLVAGKETREFWSAESADAQPTYQGSDGGNGSIFTFNTVWPGPRRFRATANRNGFQIEGLQDILVKANREPEYLKGATLGCTWWEKNWFDIWGPIENWVYPTLNRLKEMGINNIVLVPQWEVINYTSTDIHPNYDSILDIPSQKYIRVTLTDQEITQIVNCVRDFGMGVMFKPHIRIHQKLNPGDSDIYLWMGYLQPAGGDWDALFASYLNFILHYAILGEQLGVENMSLGTELNSMTLSNWRGFGVPDPDPRWRNIINEVRKVYKGKLTLSSDSNQYGNQDNVSNITFWDALDFIGFEPYLGLTGGEDPFNNGKNDPTLQELVDGFQYWAEYALLPLVNRYEKKAFITESSYYSFNGVNRNPIGVIGSIKNEVDWKEQADCYGILFDYLRKNTIFEAVNLWDGWIMNYVFNGGSWEDFYLNLKPLDIQSIFYGKPTEKIIQTNWKR